METAGFFALVQAASQDQFVKSTSTTATRPRAVMALPVKTKSMALNAFVLRESLEQYVKVSVRFVLL